MDKQSINSQYQYSSEQTHVHRKNAQFEKQHHCYENQIRLEPDRKNPQ